MNLTGCAALAGVLIVLTTVARPQDQVFRSGVDTVTVDVSVRRRNQPVTGLSAEDFHLTDNGVQQEVAVVTVEAVPVDVTVFHDTSPSQGGRLEDHKRDVRQIFDLLRRGDRLRLLVFGGAFEVVDVFGWKDAGADIDLARVGIAPMSPVNDGIMAALLHRPDVGRRHLVVALTDTIDSGSVTSAAEVQQVAMRSESVLHLVLMGTRGQNPWPDGPFIWQPVFVDPDGAPVLQQAADLTGGGVRAPLFRGANPVEEFERILDDFRRSYVLRYSPTGVERSGWHEIQVTLPGENGVTVNARRGYYGR